MDRRKEMIPELLFEKRLISAIQQLLVSKPRTQDERTVDYRWH